MYLKHIDMNVHPDYFTGSYWTMWERDRPNSRIKDCRRVSKLCKELLLSRVWHNLYHHGSVWKWCMPPNIAIPCGKWWCSIKNVGTLFQTKPPFLWPFSIATFVYQRVPYFQTATCVWVLNHGMTEEDTSDVLLNWIARGRHRVLPMAMFNQRSV